MPQYNTRPQRPRQQYTPKAIQDQVYAETGGLCFYCGWVAESIDHIIPYSYGGTDDPYNLVAACLLCNHLAGNKIFDDVEAKRDYLLEQYARRPQYSKRRKQLCFCAECHRLFRPSWQGSTAFLCARCNASDLFGGVDTPEDRQEMMARLNRQLRERRARYG